MDCVSLVPSLHSQLFFACCKKSGREPGQIRHVKCVISAGRVRGFVECSDLAALLVHMESQKSSCKFSFKLSERKLLRLASLNVTDTAWPLKLAM